MLINLFSESFNVRLHSPTQHIYRNVMQGRIKLNLARSTLFIWGEVLESEHRLELGYELGYRLEDLWT